MAKNKGPCKKPGKDISKTDLRDRHKVRMLAKTKFRAYAYQNFDSARPVYVPANLGVNHPDYGMSMRDHLAEKAKRVS